MSQFRFVFLCAALFAVGCGDHIGDECSLSTECSPQGDRICIDSQNGGYCTIPGCDHDTCPEEAVCVRFFPLGETNRECTQETEDISSDDCTPDEMCTLSGFCVPRTAEVRFCMLACDSQAAFAGAQPRATAEQRSPACDSGATCRPRRVRASRTSRT